MSNKEKIYEVQLTERHIILILKGLDELLYITSNPEAYFLQNTFIELLNHPTYLSS